MIAKIKPSVIMIVIFCLSLAAGWILYFLFGHQIINALCQGKLAGSLGTLIKPRIRHPAEYYFIKADALVTFYTILAVIMAFWLFLISLFKLDSIFKKYLVSYCLLGTLLFFVRLDKVVQTIDILGSVFYGTALAPNLYRIVVPGLAALSKTIFPVLPWTYSAWLWNYVFILLVLPLFHFYLRKWFDDRICFVLTLILYCIIPLSFLFDYPEDFLELFSFILGFMYIRDKKDVLLYPLIVFSTLNRETSVILVFSYFVTNINKHNFTKIITKSFGFFLCWLLPFISIRMIRGITAYRDVDSLFTVIKFNLKMAINGVLLRQTHLSQFLFFIFSFYICYLIFAKKRELFLSRNLITVFLFIFLSFFAASIYEIRSYCLVLPIFIPLAFFSLLSKDANPYK